MSQKLSQKLPTMFTVTLLHDFMISKIEYKNGVTNYWLKGGKEIKFCVHESDLVSDLLNSLYGPGFFSGQAHGTFPHHGSQIVIFDEAKGRVVLKQHLSWAEQGIYLPIHVVRHRPSIGLFNAAAAA
jgi:hypothetical protein